MTEDEVLATADRFKSFCEKLSEIVEDALAMQAFYSLYLFMRVEGVGHDEAQALVVASARAAKAEIEAGDRVDNIAKFESLIRSFRAAGNEVGALRAEKVLRETYPDWEPKK